MDDLPWDFLIIGQGLAGSLLAWQLIQKNYRVLVLSDASASASRMAAGLINPITGKRLVKSPQVDILLPHAMTCYQQLAQHFGQTFFHKKDMLRVFNSDENKLAWKKRIHDADYHPYLGDLIQVENYPDLNIPRGGFRQKQTGYLDTVMLLDCLDHYFNQHNAIRYIDVNYDDINCSEKHVSVKNIRSRHLIFCEGYKAVNNPWFNWLPFKLAKGDILTLRIDDYTINETVNAGRWLLPHSQGLYKFGATYQWDNLNQTPDANARQTLLKALDQLLKQKKQIQVMRHDAGIRPSTRDTQPFIGMHPQHPRLGIFNGFGSKGSLLIPYYSQQFVSQFTTQDVDMAEADIQRYWKVH